jgi:hypothetical protein
LQEGAGDENAGSSSGTSETGTSPMPTSTTKTGSSTDASSGSTDAPPQTTGGLDDTGSTSDTPDTGSTTAPATTMGSTDETGVPMNVHDGEYTGTLSLPFTVFDVGAFPCDGIVTFTVAEAGVPQITGAGSCQAAVPQWGAGAFVDVTITVDGALAGAAGSGNLNLGIAALGASDTSSWSGTFAGDTFDGSFSDSMDVLGFATTYDGTWTTTR